MKSNYTEQLQIRPTTPYLIALKQEVGETVRVADEVLEVAADVTIQIKTLRQKYFKEDNLDQ